MLPMAENSRAYALAACSVGPMARIRLACGDEYSLSPRHVIGRAPACQLQLRDPRISAFHVELIWDGRGWNLQDLGSRNGTSVQGRPAAPGQTIALELGDEVTLAGSARFSLIETSAPHLIAMAPDGEVREAVDEMLSLPSDDEVELTIYRACDDSWVVESADGTRPANEREPVFAGGRSWRLMLPTTIPDTRELDQQWSVHRSQLRFLVSRDGEHVELELIAAGDTLALEPRAHLMLLLTLARVRQSEAEAEQLPSSEHGWVYRDELPKMLGIQPHLVNIWIHRARKQLAAAGVRDAATIIERRANGSQLRVGARSLTILDA